MSVEGLCSACLLRLAMVEEPIPSDAIESLPRLDQASAIQGQSIGNYELLDEISRGGMGIVYRARQVNAGRVVAVKVMLPQLLPIAGMRERFRREIEAVARLDHPNILPIYEVGEHAGLPYFSMKLAEHGSLDQRVATIDGKWREIAGLVAVLAHAIEHAHSRGILHRDLKPANILFDSQDTPMVADFGLAKLRIMEGGLTIPASALGSPNYMAPEQVSVEFGELGPRTDVYGLGAILYELLTGRTPIAGEDALETLRLLPVRRPRPCREIRDDVPVDLESIALKCLAKSPAERYDSAEALAADLQRWLEGHDTLAARHRPARLSRRILAGTAIALVLLALVSWLSLRGTRGPAEPAANMQAAATMPRSVGVVPFRNVGGDARDDDLTTMVTDDLLRELRQVKSLEVLPFRMGLDHSGQNDPASLSAQLGVEMLLLGDVTRDGGALHVKARLWDARAGRDLWQRDFATSERDLRELRRQIAIALVTGLQIDIGEDWQAHLAPDALTSSADAYRKYLHARYLLRWRRPETLERAAQDLRDAVALDPGFARAHAALAAVYALWIPNTPLANGDARELSIRSANRALALSPRLAEAHAVLGSHASMSGHLVDAEASFRRAMDADPRDPSALHFYTIHLFAVGRLRHALETERRSVALDATSAQPMMWLAMLTTLRGDRAEALRLWQKTEEMGAARPLSAAIARLELGEGEELRHWFNNRAERDGIPEHLEGEEILVQGVLDASQRERAIAWLRKVERQVTPPFAITHYALLGSADDAFRMAENYDLFADSSYLLRPTNLWAPRTAALRRDPRFSALAKRWGLLDYWQRVAVSDLCKLHDGGVTCE